MPRKLNWSAVRNFHTALSHACADRLREKDGAELLFFADADVLIDTTVGYTLPRQNRERKDNDHLIVPALATLGYVPALRILGPHAAEFQTVIRQLRRHYVVPAIASGHIQYLKQVWQVGAYERELEAVARSGGDAAAFASILEGKARDMLVTIALCLGETWVERLERFIASERICLDCEQPPRASRELEGALFRALSAYRRHADDEPNNVADAVALGMIAAAVVDERFGDRIRFLSSTSILDRIMADRRFAAQVAGIREQMRSTLYFVIRSSFAELVFPSIDAPEGSDFTWAQLIELRDSLGEVLGGPRESTPGPTLGKRRIGKWSIDGIIRGVSELELARSCVFTANTTSAMEEWLPRLASAYRERNTRRRITDELDKRFETLNRKLSTGLERWTHWRRCFDAVQKAAAMKFGSRRGLTPALGSEIGLARWDLPARVGHGAAGIEAFLHDLISADHTARVTRRSDLAYTLTEKPKNLASVEIGMCATFFLGAHELLLEFWRQCQGDQTDEGTYVPAPLFSGFEEQEVSSWPALAALANVARIRMARQDARSAEEFEQRSKAALRRALAEIVAIPSRAGHAPRWMGVAQAAYWGWKYAGEYLKREHLQGSDASRTRWLVSLRDAFGRLSWAAASNARPLLSTDSEAFVFCINLLAQIGSMLRPEPQDVVEHLDMLARLHRNQRNYRFADTLMWSHGAEIERIAGNIARKDLLTDPAHEQKRADILQHLSAARRYLPDISETFGDEDVEQHIRAITDWCVGFGISVPA